MHDIHKKHPFSGPILDRLDMKREAPGIMETTNDRDAYYYAQEDLIWYGELERLCLGNRVIAIPVEYFADYNDGPREYARVCTRTAIGNGLCVDEDAQISLMDWEQEELRESVGYADAKSAEDDADDQFKANREETGR